jgi:2-polyprenyl-6-methoxyphenol hydroxylase-like FAD-dependent oxidoreductase
VSIGFDMVPVGRPRFAFPALDYYAERPSDRLAYLTLFPMGSVMRANFFTYRDAHDPWLKRMRSETNDAVFEVLPNLRKIVGDFAVVGDVKIRPVDLMRVKNFRRSGVVVVGDAFATSCPAAGTGTDKVFTDVERLCNHYIPLWLKTPGMATAKISAF